MQIQSKEKEKIYQANIQYLAVPVEEGTHTIELRYSNPYIRLGLYVSIIGWILWIIFVWGEKRKKRVE